MLLLLFSYPIESIFQLHQTIEQTLHPDDLLCCRPYKLLKLLGCRAGILHLIQQRNKWIDLLLLFYGALTISTDEPMPVVLGFGHLAVGALLEEVSLDQLFVFDDIAFVKLVLYFGSLDVLGRGLCCILRMLHVSVFSALHAPEIVLAGLFTNKLILFHCLYRVFGLPKRVAFTNLTLPYILCSFASIQQKQRGRLCDFSNLSAGTWQVPPFGGLVEQIAQLMNQRCIFKLVLLVDDGFSQQGIGLAAEPLPQLFFHYNPHKCSERSIIQAKSGLRGFFHQLENNLVLPEQLLLELLDLASFPAQDVSHLIKATLLVFEVRVCLDFVLPFDLVQVRVGLEILLCLDELIEEGLLHGLQLLDLRQLKVLPFRNLVLQLLIPVLE